MLRLGFYLLVALSAGAGCSLYFDTEPAGDNPTPGPDAGVIPDASPSPDAPAPTVCELRSLDALLPGFPFDVQRFQRDVYPTLYEGCSLAGCHDADTVPYGFRIWRSDDVFQCAEIQTFNQLFDWVDLYDDPTRSALITNIDGTNEYHPLQLAPDDYALEMLLDFIQQASDLLGPDIDPVTNPLDYDVFNTIIQPMLDDSLCSVSGCHNALDQYTVTFELIPFAAPYSVEMERNFLFAGEHSNLSDPENSSLYIYATNGHRNLTISSPDILLEWLRSPVFARD